MTHPFGQEHFYSIAMKTELPAEDEDEDEEPPTKLVAIVHNVNTGDFEEEMELHEDIG